MEKKICSKCKTEKDFNEYYKSSITKDGYRGECKVCIKLAQKKYQKNNRDSRNLLQKKWREKNKDKLHRYGKKNYSKNAEKIKMKSKQYRSENAEKIKKHNKKYYNENKETEKNRVRDWVTSNQKKRTEYIKEWKLKNSDKIKKYKKEKYYNDIVYKISCNVRGRILQFLKTKKIIKNSKTFEIVGCSPLFLKEYLENQFTEGMSWDKMGKYIHIDHIIPLSSVNSKEEIYKLCHYTNLQPLWAEDNVRKSNKII